MVGTLSPAEKRIAQKETEPVTKVVAPDTDKAAAKTTKRPKVFEVDETALQEASDWLNFMKTRGFTGVVLSLSEGKVRSAKGLQQNVEHEVTPFLRTQMEN